MFPVRSYSVRQRRRNMEAEASFKRRLELRRRLSSSSTTIVSSAHPPALRSLSAGTTPQHRALRRTQTSASEGAEPLRRLFSTGSEPASDSMASISEPWKGVTQETLYESTEFGSQDSSR